mmetsp:Transcript_10806/g.15241  ORF Transcript_10806/g.15241 Transcript_10806/m.15241 type:complete len:771 (-) Transcript_10806:530-2842(-)|eukprot:CAMPEP_0184867848 /NCGR_PEP_ID=MMETSP0580-20130426/27972_1 /TAXON_ID=1118495 /ORGANISM="Dactyliosolen fragilissimus" /LENGTH=770 /DNA_ID=CAMNT_0027368327 /DNA_START=218 /DNA_END=2530 /DNA_ORIENTATION=+
MEGHDCESESGNNPSNANITLPSDSGPHVNGVVSAKNQNSSGKYQTQFLPRATGGGISSRGGGGGGNGGRSGNKSKTRPNQPKSYDGIGNSGKLNPKSGSSGEKNVKNATASQIGVREKAGDTINLSESLKEGATTGIGSGHKTIPSPSKTLAQLRTLAIAHPQQQVTLTCYIPPSRVGAVIGRRGATIVHIQREAAKRSKGHNGQVRVNVVSGNPNTSTSGNVTGNNHNIDKERESSTDANQSQSQDQIQKGKGQLPNPAPWIPVVIRADPVGAFAAARLLLPLLSVGHPDDSEHNKLHHQSNTSANGTSNTSEKYSSEMDDVVLDIPIHRSRHSAIIGRKGLTIANLSADHNVRIMVPHRSGNPGPNGGNVGRDRDRERDNLNSDSNDASMDPNLNSSSNVCNKSGFHVPSGINIVQLEGELDNVEKCLAAIMTNVCPNPRVGDKHISTKITSEIGDDCEDKDVDSKNEKTIDPKSSQAKGLSTDKTSKDTDQKSVVSRTKGNEIVNNSPVRNSSVSTNNPKDHTASNHASSSHRKEGSKYIERTVSVPPELYHLVPSLGRIRILGKTTSTVIRRRRIDSSIPSPTAELGIASDSSNQEDEDDPTNNKNNETTSDDMKDSNKKNNNNLTPCLTQLVVSGRTACVEDAISRLETMLDPNSKSTPKPNDCGDNSSSVDAEDESGTPPDEEVTKGSENAQPGVRGDKNEFKGGKLGAIAGRNKGGRRSGNRSAVGSGRFGKKRYGGGRGGKAVAKTGERADPVAANITGKE